MRIPRTVSILGRTIKIKVGKNLCYQGEPVLGLCDYDNRVIYLEKNQSQRQLYDTYVHEATHYFLTLCGMDQRMSEGEVEMYCQLMTAFVNDLK
jgi:hypothetical protein